MQKICLIIPCYNEANRFNQTHFLEFVRANPRYDFCLVNDGSTDNTANILSKLSGYSEKQIDFVNLKENVGKAEAVRKAILHCLKKEYAYIGYIDADFSAPLSEVNHIVSFCGGELTHGIIAGSRIKRLGASIVRSPARHYFGRMFATLAGLILKLPIYDSQCGLKLIRTDIAKMLFSEPFMTKWLFDLEIWLRYRNMVGLELASSESIEIPLNRWQEKGGSKLKFMNFLKVPFLLCRIHFRYNSATAKKS
jgi:dolichyl-phosphate beta-glucosyltransferase